MQHAFDARIELARPLRDVATVFDMTGLALHVRADRLRCDEPGIDVSAQSIHAGVFEFAGAIEDARLDPNDVLTRLALALEADGHRFRLRLFDADGTARVTYESDH